MITKNDQKFYREQNLKNTNLHAPKKKRPYADDEEP